MKRHHFSPTKAFLAAALAFATVATGGHATTITVEDSDSLFFLTAINDSDVGVSIRRPSATVGATNAQRTSLSLPQFNPTFGILTGILVKYDTFASPRLGALTFTCRDSGIINSSCQRENATHEGSAATQLDAPFDGQGYVSGTDVIYDVAEDDFDAFIGTGSIIVPWRNSYRHNVNGFCDPDDGTIITRCSISSNAQFLFSADLTIQYTYMEPTPPPSPVPLPAGSPMLLAALGGLAFLRRRGRTMDI